MGIESHNITDNATEILDSLCDWSFSGPRLLNVNTVRMFWHAGAGTDGETRDLLKDQDISQDLQRFEKLWRSRLEIQ